MQNLLFAVSQQKNRAFWGNRRFPILYIDGQKQKKTALWAGRSLLKAPLLCDYDSTKRTAWQDEILLQGACTLCRKRVSLLAEK